MAVETWLHSSGSWRKANNVYVNRSGNWTEAKEVWTKQSGTWRKVYQKMFQLNDTATGYNYNVYNSATSTGGWDGISPILANITVSGILGSATSTSWDWQGYLDLNPDVNAGAISWSAGRPSHTTISYAKYHYYTFGISENRTLPYFESAPAFDTGSLPEGSIVNLSIPSGAFVVGAGGIGGYGGMYVDHGGPTPYTPSTGGSPGAIAIKTTATMIIINNGTISGGGGGGGGGAGAGGGQAYDDPGGAGGGGAGSIPGVQGGSYRSGSYIGQDGTLLTGGNGGTLSYQGSREWASASAGGRGGDLGQAGSSSTATSGGAGFPGGDAGAAISGISNVTFQVSGNVLGRTY